MIRYEFMLLKPVRLLCLLTFCSRLIYASVYQDTINQIKTIYQNSSIHKHQDFLALDIIQDNLKFKDFLSELINQANFDFLKQITAYYHPVGFIKIILYRGDQGEQLRLHFWRKGILQNFHDGWEPIHNHRWNFSSKVIRGSLLCREYQDSGLRLKRTKISDLKNIDYLNRLYEVLLIPANQNSDIYHVISSDTVAVINDCVCRQICAGQSYYLDNCTPHQVKSELDTATILLLDPPAKTSASEVFTTKLDHFEHDLKLQYLDILQIKQHLADFLATLNY